MIEINNLTDFLINKKFFQKFIQNVLEDESKKTYGLSIALVSQAEIKKLNKQYLGKDRATDVLAFPEGKLKTPEIFGNNILGEIIICPEEVKKNAKDLKLGFKKELFRILTHGILHLLGYDHEKSTLAFDAMQKKENYYLEKYFK